MNTRFTKLTLAVKKGDLKTVKQLIQDGNDINERDGAGWYPIHRAVIEEHIEILQFLLQLETVDLNVRNGNGSTPLHCAVIENNLDIVQLLINHGAIVNLCDHFGNTAVSSAAAESHHDLIRYFLTVDFCAERIRHVDSQFHLRLATNLLDAVTTDNKKLLGMSLILNALAYGWNYLVFPIRRMYFNTPVGSKICRPVGSAAAELLATTLQKLRMKKLEEIRIAVESIESMNLLRKTVREIESDLELVFEPPIVSLRLICVAFLRKQLSSPDIDRGSEIVRLKTLLPLELIELLY